MNASLAAGIGNRTALTAGHERKTGSKGAGSRLRVAAAEGRLP
ncbi:MAG: hypothetical protein ACM3PU_16230 [Gemmatimonadota bacterium]